MLTGIWGSRISRCWDKHSPEVLSRYTKVSILSMISCTQFHWKWSPPSRNPDIAESVGGDVPRDCSHWRRYRGFRIEMCGYTGQLKKWRTQLAQTLTWLLAEEVDHNSFCAWCYWGDASLIVNNFQALFEADQGCERHYLQYRYIKTYHHLQPILVCILPSLLCYFVSWITAL